MPKRWLAILLSLLMAGLGHVYSGRVGRALCIFGLLELLAGLMSWLFAAGPVNLAVLLAAPIAAIAVAIAVAIDAYKTAGRGRLRFHRKATLWGGCLGFVLFSVLVGVALETVRERNLGEPFRIPSGAMFPTLLIGDHFFTNPLIYRSREPQRGDVVIIIVARDGSATLPADQRPELPRERFVKRIVGLPGDQIAFSGTGLLVNGKLATESEPKSEFVDNHGRRLLVLSEKLDGHEYQILDSPAVQLPDAGPLIVEPGRYFVAGDNRDHSKDSRVFGTISREHVVAPTSRIYWSWDFNGPYSELARPSRVVQLLRSHTRWSRIGLRTN
jgi:signal peptidase I